MNLEVGIPIKKYLKKFIAKTHNVEPFIISTGKCHFSALILDPIKKDFFRHDLKLDDDVYTLLTVVIPLGENKYTIDMNTALRINQRLKSMFDQQLIDLVTITNGGKGDIYKRIEQFTEYYDITEDDLKFETIVKMFYRARNPPKESAKLIKEEMANYQLRLELK